MWKITWKKTMKHYTNFQKFSRQGSLVYTK